MRVTGGAGFIGSSLVCTLLEKSRDVTILDNVSVGLRYNIPRNSRLRLVTGNARDFELLPRGDFLNLHMGFTYLSKLLSPKL